MVLKMCVVTHERKSFERGSPCACACLHRLFFETGRLNTRCLGGYVHIASDHIATQLTDFLLIFCLLNLQAQR